MMLVIIVAYLGGLLTIASPCILPVLPFVFARSDQPFTRSGLPLLLGMALNFTLFATLTAVGGGWVVPANQYGRIAALVLMAVFGVTLLFPHARQRYRTGWQRHRHRTAVVSTDPPERWLGRTHVQYRV